MGENPNASRRSQAVDVAVGSRVRRRRRQLKISQAVLAQKIGVTFQQLQKCERGVNRIGAGRLYQIALLLQVPVDYFFEDLPRKPRLSPEDVEAEASARLREEGMLVGAFASISDSRTRRQIVDMVYRMAGK